MLIPERCVSINHSGISFLHSNIHVSLMLNIDRDELIDSMGKCVVLNYNYLHVCLCKCVSARCMLLFLTSSSRLRQSVRNIERRIVSEENSRENSEVVRRSLHRLSDNDMNIARFP